MASTEEPHNWYINEYKGLNDIGDEGCEHLKKGSWVNLE